MANGVGHAGRSRHERAAMNSVTTGSTSCEDRACRARHGSNRERACKGPGTDRTHLHAATGRARPGLFRPTAAETPPPGTGALLQDGVYLIRDGWIRQQSVVLEAAGPKVCGPVQHRARGRTDLLVAAGAERRVPRGSGCRVPFVEVLDDVRSGRHVPAPLVPESTEITQARAGVSVDVVGAAAAGAHSARVATSADAAASAG